MSKLLIKPEPRNESGNIVDVTPESAGWTYVGFAVRKLSEGEGFRDQFEDDRETCIVVLSGIIDITVNEEVFEEIGRRMSVFERTPPFCVFVPAGAQINVRATTETEIAICSAPATSERPVRVITPEEIKLEQRGEGTNTRFVNALLAGEDDADSLILFEVYTPSGHWSSYPPHKHDEDNLPTESALEEIYHHKVSPPQGFAFQRVYTDERDIDETMTVEDGDTVLVPRGYHPVGAPHGYELYYLNVMAGPTRKWIFNNDPDHEWIVKS